MAVPDWPQPHHEGPVRQDLQVEVGNKVTLDVDFHPWPDYYPPQRVAYVRREEYNMACPTANGSALSSRAYYLNINKYVDADPDLRPFQGPHPR